MPTICCFLPPTPVCFWPSSTSACRKTQLWFPWKLHLRPPPPQTYATRLGWHSSGGPRCPATPSLAWEPPPGFHQGLSDPFLWQRPRQPRCQATWSGARTSAAREMCLTNLSSLGRTEQQNCTCTQSELFAQLCTLCFYCFPTRTPSSHTPLDICLAAGSTGKSALAHGQIPAMAPAEVQRAKRTQNH